MCVCWVLCYFNVFFTPPYKSFRHVVFQAPLFKASRSHLKREPPPPPSTFPSVIYKIGGKYVCDGNWQMSGFILFATVFIASFPTRVGQSIPCCREKHLNSVSIWTVEWQPAGQGTCSKWQNSVCWAWTLEISASFIRLLAASKIFLCSKSG